MLMKLSKISGELWTFLTVDGRVAGGSMLYSSVLLIKIDLGASEWGGLPVREDLKAAEVGADDANFRRGVIMFKSEDPFA